MWFSTRNSSQFFFSIESPPCASASSVSLLFLTLKGVAHAGSSNTADDAATAAFLAALHSHLWSHFARSDNLLDDTQGVNSMGQKIIGQVFGPKLRHILGYVFQLYIQDKFMDNFSGENLVLLNRPPDYSELLISLQEVALSFEIATRTMSIIVNLFWISATHGRPEGGGK